jgi:hypothetical protein
MKRQTKTFRFWTPRKLTAAIAIVVLLLCGTIVGVCKVRYYQEAVDQANIVEIRELIVQAARGLKKDAPVEPRTGDVYFPESRLYLPNPKMPLALTYLLDTDDVTDAQSELSISTYPIRGTTALYTAKNNLELFAAVPKLQACLRGVKLVYQKFPATDTQNVFQYTTRLDNGKDLHVYIEKDCPELADTAALFKQIKPY